MIPITIWTRTTPWTRHNLQACSRTSRRVWVPPAGKQSGTLSCCCHNKCRGGGRDGSSCHTADSCRDRHPSQAAAAVRARRSSSFCIINVALTMPEEGGRARAQRFMTGLWLLLHSSHTHFLKEPVSQL